MVDGHWMRIGRAKAKSLGVDIVQGDDEIVFQTANGSGSALVPPRKAHILVRGLCGSAEAVLGNCLQRRVLQGPRVGVLAGLYKIVQVEVACDE